jgi:saccharopine dehydrogenase (NAD+, L-lysine-forming)
MASLHI